MAKNKKKLATKVKKQQQFSDETMEKTINETVAAVTAAANSNSQLAMAKICRLCEAKDGPFLNIFGSDVALITKIDQLLPITVKETDQLPHKICFRCSAKVEDLYEFTKRCIRAQENLSKKIGKTHAPIKKIKKDTRTAWEEKLNKTKMSNEQICHEMIKKAMQGIGNIEIPDLPEIPKPPTPPPPKSPTPAPPSPKPAKETEDRMSFDDIRDAVIKKAVESIANIDLATLQAKRLELIQSKSLPIESEPNKNEDSKNHKTNGSLKMEETKTIQQEDNELLVPVKEVKVSIEKFTKEKPIPTRQTRHSKTHEPKKEVEKTPEITKAVVPEKEITHKQKTSKKKDSKANKASKKKSEEEIMKHVACIRVGGVGDLFTCQLCKRNFLKREVVLTHVCQKIQPLISVGKPPSPLPISSSPEPMEPDSIVEKPILKEPEPIVENKIVKKKPGPKSKTKVHSNQPNETPPASIPNIGINANTPALGSFTSLPMSIKPTLTLPDNPQKRYKLVGGPNNTFMLVEDEPAVETKPAKSKKSSTKKSNISQKSPECIIDLEENEPNEILPDLDSSYRHPYPVGFISAVKTSESIVIEKPKLDHYTVKPSTNPNKIVISTKQEVVAKEVKKKPGRKRKHNNEVPIEQPYSLLMEDLSRNIVKASKSYSTIQESQISTSSKDSSIYKCPLCNLTFSREKKLEAHLKEHSERMTESSDEEVNMWKSNKRRKNFIKD